jgi:hypothetical protein
MKINRRGGEIDLWYLDTLALAVELPAMVQALELAVNDLALRQLR